MERFPRLNLFGELRPEVYRGRTRVYLAAPTPNLVNPSTTKDRVDVVTTAFLFMKEQLTSRDPVVKDKPEEKIDIDGEGAGIITGCHCFCNKQIAEICSSFSGSDEISGKSLSTLRARSSKATLDASTSTVSTTTTTTAGTSTTSAGTFTATTAKTSTTTIVGTSTTSNYTEPTTESSTFMQQNATALAENATEDSTVPDTIVSSDVKDTIFTEATIEKISRADIVSTESPETDLTISPSTDEPSIATNDSNLPDKEMDGNKTGVGQGLDADDDDLTVIYPKVTYQTVSAYAQESPRRRARSIIDTIPMLSRKQVEHKTAVEATRELARELVDLEIKLKKLGESEDSGEAGEGIIGPYVRQIIQFTELKEDLAFRTSMYSDQLENILESISDRVKINFMLWKILERFVVIPGYLQGPEYDKEELCTANVYNYFPQYFLESQLPKNETRFNNVLANIKKSMNSQSYASVEKSLRGSIADIRLLPANLPDFEYATYIDQLLQLDRSPEDAQLGFLARQVPLADQTDEALLDLYDEVNLVTSFFYWLTSPRDRDPTVDLQRLVLNITAGYVQEVGHSTLNVENFGELGPARQLVIQHGYKTCEKDAFAYKNITSIC